MDNQLPSLRKVALRDLEASGTYPSPKIRTDADVEHWKTTQSYRDYGLFLQRLNEAVIGVYLPWNPPQRSSGSKAVQRTLELLDELDRWIIEIPPLQTPQRFGNLAFRQWGERLEERCDNLLCTLLGPAFERATPFIKPYFLTSFGSFTRMDYGTGHEASFALFLLCLTLIRFFQPKLEEERELVLSIFVRYLSLCWRLQDSYRLEPAGSHGVWGLDDYSFLPYIFGSGELRDQKSIPVSSILSTPLPPTNLYNLAISRIHDVKTGPFHEHSSQLHSIAVGVGSWSKVNSGLFKMYQAEVLGKRVVVQHIPLGGILEWHDGTQEAPGDVTAAFAPRPPTHISDGLPSMARGSPHPSTTASAPVHDAGSFTSLSTGFPGRGNTLSSFNTPFHYPSTHQPGAS